MSDEPLYCQVCGQEWGEGPDCGHDSPPNEGPYCHVCGVIPAPGKACHFYVTGGNARGCSSEVDKIQ